MAISETSNQPVERHIKWGGVLKGVAIVAAVVVAAVVGYVAITALAGAVLPTLTTGAGGSLLAGANSALVTVGEGMGWAIGSVGHLLSLIPSGLVSLFGLGGQQFAGTSALTNMLGLGGAAVAGAVATHALTPTLDHTQLTTTTPAPTSPSDTGLVNVAGFAAPAVPVHHIAHMSHHAAEAADESAGKAWTEKFQPRGNSYASFADNVRAQKDERKSPVQPAESFTEQLNTDRANLDAALAK